MTAMAAAPLPVETIGAEIAGPEVVRTVEALRARIAEWRGAGRSVGLVPTMGALHDGHLALLRAALVECDRAVVTVFVNPAQFAPTEDFASYPRGEGRALALIAATGGHLAFVPDDGIGRAHVCTPVPTATTVCRLLL